MSSGAYGAGDVRGGVGTATQQGQLPHTGLNLWAHLFIALGLFAFGPFLLYVARHPEEF